MHCNTGCGGQYREKAIADFDFTAFSGVPSTVRRMKVLRCDRCSDELLHGRWLEPAARALAALLVASPDRLDGPRAAFLRRRLDLTQKELAERMGVTRESVARWERSRAALSSAMDYVLRGIVLAAMGPALEHGDLVRCFEAQRTVHAPVARSRRRPPLVIDVKAA